MFNKILNAFQTLLNFCLFSMNTFLFVLSIMGLADNRFAFLLETNDSMFTINLSTLTTLLFGIWVLFYMFLYMHTLILCLKISKTETKYTDSNTENNDDTDNYVLVKRDFFIKSILILVNTMIVIFWLWFIVYQINIYKFGHMPFLDVNYREHDKDSVCWNGYLTYAIDENTIKNNNCLYVNNNLVESNYIQVKCVRCRKLITEDEGTFFNQNFTSVSIAVLTVLVIQLWNTYAVLRNLQRNKLNKAQPPEIKMTTYSFDNEEEENTEEESTNSDKLMFEQIYEARKSVTPPSSRASVQPQKITLSSSSCTCNDNIYSTPASLRCCCNVKARNNFNADWVFRPLSSINVEVTPSLPLPSISE
ncbi:ARIF-1 [Parapoynx stagnalis nucleopolyhedrovirus]|uniref:ARIF-1 n=1 Tax=Parapoynx stagnalis nucleopolyhedrovirus TaxID=2993413 RepID=A0A9E7Y707_9ABAC|nr:ARIF-1 [Parapoynx stagnalis nucleopolyhedrovirus]